jgi:GT2 family glycosyltransferase
MDGVQIPIARWRIVVPVHNALQDVTKLIEHLEWLDPDLPGALILVDDGSTDGTSQVVGERYPTVCVVRGDGNLWWGGGMRLGMQTALTQDADIIFWLNHDCFPLPRAFEKLASVLQDPKVGCASGWCRIKGYPDYPVNPGFRSFRALCMSGNSDLVEADGVNGNFVGFRTDAVRKIGLPDAEAFPHYGDGVYTVRFSRAGYRVLVCTSARADLEFELERRLSPFWRVAVNRGGLRKWLSYYFLSPRSLYHVVNRYRQIKLLRGVWKSPFYAAVLNTSLAAQIFAGVAVRKALALEAVRAKCVHVHEKLWPSAKLREELASL